MSRALIVVDTQVDFCEGGSLAVSGGLAVAAKIRKFMFASNLYDFRFSTQDWHDPDNDNGGHFSPEPDYVDTWPVHCVSYSNGAELAKPLDRRLFNNSYIKGMGKPSYSGFDGVSHYTFRKLEDDLSASSVKVIDVCGIATDYCVKATVLGGLDRGYEVRVLSDLTAAVGDQQKALGEMEAAGATIL